MSALSRAQLADGLETEVLRFLETERARANAPGIAAAIAVSGRMVFTGGVGYAEIENRVPMDGGSVLNVGSVSKVMAVLGLMKLWEEGRIAWSDPLQKHLPWLPAGNAPGESSPTPITLEHILTHSSGYRHYLDDAEKEFGPKRFKALVHYDSIREAAEIFMNDPLLFRPGAHYSYSSYASNLIQAVGEAVASQPYEEFLRAHVFRPAGMLTAAFDVKGRVVANRGRGYRFDSKTGAWRDGHTEDVSYKYTGGGMIASVEDLVRMGVALNHGRILKRETVDELYRVRFKVVSGRAASSGEKSVYAAPGGNPDELEERELDQALILYGSRDPFGRRWLGHSGGVQGTSTYFLNYPDENVVVAVRANGGDFDSLACVQTLAQLVLPPGRPGRDP